MRKYRIHPGDLLLIYRVSTGQLREVHTDDAGKFHPLDLPSTLAVVVIPKRYVLARSLQQYVTDHCGLIPPSARHAVVDVRTGIVTAAIICEPNLDPAPRGQLYVQDDQAGPGWTYDARTGVFTAPTIIPIGQKPN